MAGSNDSNLFNSTDNSTTVVINDHFDIRVWTPWFLLSICCMLFWYNRKSVYIKVRHPKASIWLGFGLFSVSHWHLNAALNTQVFVNCDLILITWNISINLVVFHFLLLLRNYAMLYRKRNNARNKDGAIEIVKKKNSILVEFFNHKYFERICLLWIFLSTVISIVLMIVNADLAFFPYLFLDCLDVQTSWSIFTITVAFDVWCTPFFVLCAKEILKSKLDGDSLGIKAMCIRTFFAVASGFTLFAVSGVLFYIMDQHLRLMFIIATCMGYYLWIEIVLLPLLWVYKDYMKKRNNYNRILVEDNDHNDPTAKLDMFLSETDNYKIFFEFAVNEMGAENLLFVTDTANFKQKWKKKLGGEKAADSSSFGSTTSGSMIGIGTKHSSSVDMSQQGMLQREMLLDAEYIYDTYLDADAELEVYLPAYLMDTFRKSNGKSPGPSTQRKSLWADKAKESKVADANGSQSFTAGINSSRSLIARNDSSSNIDLAREINLPFKVDPNVFEDARNTLVQDICDNTLVRFLSNQENSARWNEYFTAQDEVALLTGASSGENQLSEVVSQS